MDQNTTTLPAETGVLVVGAGPAGLTLTTALAQAGIDHVTIEPKPAVSPGSKAASVQPRTLEYLDRLGVADDLVSRGLRGHGFRIAERDSTLLDIGYRGLDTDYPFLLLVDQCTTEAAIERGLHAAGGLLLRGHRLLGWQRDHPGVVATVAGPDGVVRAVRARHLVGADGVHSAVRETAGIAFEGTSPATVFALADVRLADPPGDDGTVFFLSPDGLALVSPLPGGLHRVVTSAAPGTPAPAAADVEAALAARTGGALRGSRVREIVAASTYRFQERVAARMTDDPVLLLGDAAHTHSPAGGQGMNTGIQDAGHLADALASRDPVRLERYGTERRANAQALITFTGQLTALATITDPALAALRARVLGAVGGLDDVTGWLATHLAQLDVGTPEPTVAAR